MCKEDWLERIRESGQAPPWFDLSQVEREEAEHCRREEEEAAERARQEWETARERDYAIIRVMAERDDPARVWRALLGFWEAYPGYDPDGLSSRFLPDLPLPDLLPLPFEWCEISAIVDFRLMTDEGDKGTFTITPFYMAKYPVTYAQFQVFVDAEDGFHSPKWWEDLAADANHKQQPDDQWVKVDDHPRENVSWYNAVAFCRWLTARCIHSLPLDLHTLEHFQRLGRHTDQHISLDLCATSQPQSFGDLVWA